MKHTSSLWVVLPEIYRLLDTEAQWSPIVQTGTRRPSVMFGAFTQPPGGESIIVTGSTRRSSAEWATMGTPGRDEVFESLILVMVNVPGFDAARTFARLGVLGVALEEALRDSSTGKPTITTDMAAAGVMYTSLTATDATIEPFNQAGAAGWIGAASYVLTWSARI